MTDARGVEVKKARDVVELCESRGHDVKIRERHTDDGGRYHGECQMCGMTVTIVDNPRPNEAHVMGQAVAMDCPGRNATMENSRLLSALFPAYANVYGEEEAAILIQALRYRSLEGRGIHTETLLSLGKHVRDRLRRSNPYMYGRALCLYAAAWAAGSALVKLHSHIWEGSTFPYEDVANALAFLEGGIS
jgi:hypothetical protein